MKKKSIILIGVIVVIIVIITYLIVMFVKNVSNDKKIVEDNTNTINNSYNVIKYQITNYNSLRDKVSSFINDFYYENIEDNYLSNIEALNNYDEIINKITNEVKILDTKCNIVYTDKEVNNICNNYKKDYEIIVNVFVNDINKYNSKLNSYNKDLNKAKELFKSKYINDYIDYNKDNIYEKKEEVND